MTDAEKSAAFARWNHDTSRSTAGTWDAFMAGVAAAETEKDAEIARLRKLLEPFAAYCKLISAEVPDDTQLVRRGAPDVGHCRAARDELRKGK